MCTLSWKPEPAGYRLWFNRDEQRARPPAAPPGMQRREGVPCLAPLDGAGGTWLLVNAHGMTLGLLNHYPDRLPVLPDAPRSRGLLPLACAGCGSVRAALACCAEQGLADYRPFRFVALSALEAATLTWDGREPRLTLAAVPRRDAHLVGLAARARGAIPPGRLRCVGGPHGACDARAPGRLPSPSWSGCGRRHPHGPAGCLHPKHFTH